MNLDFKTIQTIDKGGIPCLVQRCVIDRRMGGIFWSAWKASESHALKEQLMLRNENGEWAVYRTIPQDPTIQLPPTPQWYVLKDSSLLLPYQYRSVSSLTRALIDHGSAVDGSETGIGKTYSALGVCREMGLRPAIVCRKAGISGWLKACVYMGIRPHFVVNWEMARTGNFSLITRTHDEWANKWHYHWPRIKDMLVIFDEVHCAANDSTINNQLWRGVRGDPKVQVPYLALSATLADRPIRLASLFEMLGICNRDSYVRWMRSRGSFVNQHQEEESLSSVQDMKEIHRMLYPRYGTRLSYDDPDVRAYFPECVYQIELVDLGRTHLAATNKAYEKLLAKVNSYKEAGVSQADKLVAALRFRQAAELLKVPVLAEYVNEYLAEGLSVIVFVNYRETLAALANILNTRSLIFGEQETYKLPRQPVIDAFQKNESRLILAMSDAGGQSIDLHDLEGGHRRISLICPTYNPVALKQVLGRTRRANSKTTPVMKLFYAAGTIEEKVARAVSLKLDNIEALNKGDLMEPDLFNISALHDNHLGGEE